MSSIISLNGDWDFIWDGANEGLHNRWFVTVPNDVKSIEVPYVWERKHEKTEQVAFYFKKFAVDEKENAKRIFIRFENISAHASVWLNGTHIGSHFGGHSPFSLDASKGVKVGEENLLCVRVSSVNSYGKVDISRTTDDDENSRFAIVEELPVGLPWKQYPYAGIIGNVELILGDKAFISQCNVVPDPDLERINVDLQFNNPRNFSADLLFAVSNPQGETFAISKNVRLDKENHNQRFQFEFKDIQWWSPESPNTYKLEVCLNGSFSVIRNFGFRKFDCIEGDFYFNDKIVKIKGIVYNQHDQAGGLWTDDLKKARQDLKNIKELGFNFVKSGGTPFSTEILEICDELGILVFQEMPIHNQKASNQGLEKARLVIKEVIENTKSHPCIAAWVLGSENGTLMLENGNKLLSSVDELDQAHPVFSNLNSVYVDNRQNFSEDSGKVMGITTNNRILLHSSHRLHLRTHISQAMSLFLTQYGNKEFEELEIPDLTFGSSKLHEEYETFVDEIQDKILVSLKNNSLLYKVNKTATKLKGLRAENNRKALQRLYRGINAFIKTGHGKDIWATTEDFIEEINKASLEGKLDQISAIQSNPRVSGFFLDQWADYGVNLAGLTDEFRSSKGFEDFIEEITLDNKVLISALERYVKPKSKMIFNLALLNEARYEKCQASVKLLDTKGKKIDSKTIKATPETSLTVLGETTLKSPPKIGDYILRVELHHEKELIYQKDEPIICLEEPEYDFAPSVCFLDEAENTRQAKKLIFGDEPIVFTSSLSSWNDDILNSLALAVKEGKTLVISDVNDEDVEAFNSCIDFGMEINAHDSSGSFGVSAHFYTDKDLAKVAQTDGFMGNMAAAIIPSMSMTEMEGAKVFARSVNIEDDKLTDGVDIQSVKLDAGKIVFCQYNLFDNVENNVLAELLFAHLIKKICK